MKLDKEKKIVLWAVLALFALFFTVRFGAIGFRVIAGFVLIYLIPSYFLIRHTSLEDDEKIFFSLFIGISIIPSITYAVGFVSLRLGIIASALVLLGAGYIIKKLIKKED